MLGSQMLLMGAPRELTPPSGLTYICCYTNTCSNKKSVLAQAGNPMEVKLLRIQMAPTSLASLVQGLEPSSQGGQNIKAETQFSS